MGTERHGERGKGGKRLLRRDDAASILAFNRRRSKTAFPPFLFFGEGASLTALLSFGKWGCGWKGARD